ncbi:MAG: ATP synthase F1 subunit gamma [Alphaproteobacteria bacterium]|nr:ATP synthase F1 subunit gamma [Alphaproteobacteria bacterium]
MAGLKELRTRIGSIKSTQKITSAMKMVAAARLRRAQDVLAKSQQYSEDMLTVAGRLYKEMRQEESENDLSYVFPRMLMEPENPLQYLLVVFSSDRGLCGSYNSYVIREAMRRIKELRQDGKQVKVLSIGKKAGDALRHRLPDLEVEILAGVAAKGADFKELQEICERILKSYTDKEFDVCEVVYTHFASAINREVRVQRYLPYHIDIEDPRFDNISNRAFFEYDAPKQKLLVDVLLMLMTSVFFQDLLNAQASEHGARMTSMDNATRNASDMIAKLTLKYNRLRQTAITTELIEIISGAEAL